MVHTTRRTPPPHLKPHTLKVSDDETKYTLYRLAKQRIARNFDMLDRVIAMEDHICDLSTIIHRSIRNEAAIIDAFEKDGAYNFAVFFEEAETQNMPIDERLEELLGNGEGREEEDDNNDDDREIDEREEVEEEVEDEELKEGGIVRITGGTQFGHNPIRVVKKMKKMKNMVKVRDRRGNEFRKDLRYVEKV